MKPSDGKLTPKQEAALLALLSESTIEAAYESAGVSKATMWRFMQLSAFQTRYRAARRLLVETAIAQLQSDCTIAARAINPEVTENRAHKKKASFHWRKRKEVYGDPYT